MAITDNYVPLKQLGNGSTVNYSANWNPISAASLRVFLEDVATGVQVLQVLGTNYTIVSLNASGWQIQFTVAPPNTKYVVVGRAVPIDQTTPYKTSTGFQGLDEENSFDKLTAIAQDLQDQVDRSLKFQLGSSAAAYTIQDPIDGRGLKWDTVNNRIVNTDDDPDEILPIARDWATKTDGQVESTDYSAKAYAVGGTGVTGAIGSAKEWAVSNSSPNGTTDLSAKSYAALTAADRVQTGLDRVQTGADVLAAQAAAAAAAAAAAEGLYNNVVSKSFADSPFSPAGAEEGDLFRIDCTGGNVVVNLLALSVYGEDMKFGFVKVDSTANTITINRGGSDTINGGNSIVLANQWETHALVGDLQSGNWIDVIQAAVIPNGSITTPKLADNALSADAPGRAKMQDGFVTSPKFAGGLFGAGLNQGAANITLSLPGYITGLNTSNNAVDAANDIDIAAGSAAADTSPFALMTLGSTLTKRLDAAWAVGSGNGGLDTGSIANGTYHIWLIQRSDTGVVDALFSTSATSPTMPANYDRKRRIASIVRSAGSILLYRQNGSTFEYQTPVADIDVTTPGTAAVTRALTVPVGIPVEAMMVCLLSNGAAGNGHRFSALDTTDVAVGTGAVGNGQLRANSANNTAGQVRIRTNTSGQIRSRNESANADIIRCATWGWVDITRST